MARLSSKEKCFECFAKTGVFPVKGKILADEDSQAIGATQAERLVVTVPQANGKTAAIES